MRSGDDYGYRNYKSLDKLKYLLGIVIITISVYICFRYLLVYVWPFVIGVLIALLLEKPVNNIYEWIYKILGAQDKTSQIHNNSDKTASNKISKNDNSKSGENLNKIANNKISQSNNKSANDKTAQRIKSTIATIIISVISLIIIVLLIAAIITGANEISNFLKNWDYNTIGIRQQTARICLDADEFLGLEGGCCLDTLVMCGEKLVSIMPEKIFRVSVPVVKDTVIVIGGLVVGFIAVIYLSTGLNEIRSQVKESVFAEEIYMIWSEVKRLINVYFKVELKIMLINSILCMIAFFIIKNPYAVVLGIIVGIVDALPVFGTGTILIPYAIINVIMRNYMSAVVLGVVYVITYFVREIMESKCMGDKLGISPFAMLVIIFVGLLVYGIPGFITGPVSYVIIKALIMRLRCEMNFYN